MFCFGHMTLSLHILRTQHHAMTCFCTKEPLLVIVVLNGSDRGWVWEDDETRAAMTTDSCWGHSAKTSEQGTWEEDCISTINQATGKQDRASQWLRW